MNKLVLTVDDSRTMRQMLKIALDNAGFDVVQAEDGIDGIDALQQKTPRIIITDINMPRLDGYGFMEYVRSQDHLRQTPILVLTTETDAEKKARARKAGASGWIVKPFDPTKLVDAIRRVAF